MKKLTLLFSWLIIVTTTFAQHYRPFKSGEISIYKSIDFISPYSLDRVYSNTLFSDSLTFTGNDTTYYNYLSLYLHKSKGVFSLNLYTATRMSFLGKKTIFLNNGFSIITAKDDTLSLRTNVSVGDTFLFHQSKPDTFYEAIVESKAIEKISTNETDSVITYRIERVTSSNQRTWSKKMKLSSNYGFIELWPLCHFPENDIGEPIVLNYHPRIHTQIEYPTWRKIFTRNIGDRYQIIENYYPDYKRKIYEEYEVIGKQTSSGNDSIYYTIRVQKRMLNYHIIPSLSDIYTDTFTTGIDLLNDAPDIPVLNFSGNNPNKNVYIITKSMDSLDLIVSSGYFSYMSNSETYWFGGGCTDLREYLNYRGHSNAKACYSNGGIGGIDLVRYRSTTYFKRGNYVRGQYVDLVALSDNENKPDIHSFNIYPNPADDKINIVITSLSNIVFYDITGKKILSDHFEEGEHTIKSTDWKNGMYFYVIETNDGHLMQGKVIKQ